MTNTSVGVSAYLGLISVRNTVTSYILLTDAIQLLSIEHEMCSVISSTMTGILEHIKDMNIVRV